MIEIRKFVESSMKPTLDIEQKGKIKITGILTIKRFDNELTCKYDL